MSNDVVHNPRWMDTVGVDRVDDRPEVLRIVGCTCGWRMPTSTHNTDATFVRHLAFVGADSAAHGSALDTASQAHADRVHALHVELAEKAVAWALADRIADDRSADLENVAAQLEAARTAFHSADQVAVVCDEEFRKTARKLADTLEPQQLEDLDVEAT